MEDVNVYDFDETSPLRTQTQRSILHYEGNQDDAAASFMIELPERCRDTPSAPQRRASQSRRSTIVNPLQLPETAQEERDPLEIYITKNLPVLRKSITPQDFERGGVSSIYPAENSNNAELVVLPVSAQEIEDTPFSREYQQLDVDKKISKISEEKENNDAVKSQNTPLNPESENIVKSTQMDQQSVVSTEKANKYGSNESQGNTLNSNENIGENNESDEIISKSEMQTEKPVTNARQKKINSRNRSQMQSVFRCSIQIPELDNNKINPEITSEENSTSPYYNNIKHDNKSSDSYDSHVSPKTTSKEKNHRENQNNVQDQHKGREANYNQMKPKPIRKKEGTNDGRGKIVLNENETTRSSEEMQNYINKEITAKETTSEVVSVDQQSPFVQNSLKGKGKKDKVKIEIVMVPTDDTLNSNTTKGGRSNEQNYNKINAKNKDGNKHDRSSKESFTTNEKNIKWKDKIQAPDSNKNKSTKKEMNSVDFNGEKRSDKTKSQNNKESEIINSFNDRDDKNKENDLQSNDAYSNKEAVHPGNNYKQKASVFLLDLFSTNTFEENELFTNNENSNSKSNKDQGKKAVTLQDFDRFRNSIEEQGFGRESYHSDDSGSLRSFDRNTSTKTLAPGYNQSSKDKNSGKRTVKIQELPSTVEYDDRKSSEKRRGTMYVKNKGFGREDYYSDESESSHSSESNISRQSRGSGTKEGADKSGARKRQRSGGERQSSDLLSDEQDLEKNNISRPVERKRSGKNRRSGESEEYKNPGRDSDRNNWVNSYGKNTLSADKAFIMKNIRKLSMECYNAFQESGKNWPLFQGETRRKGSSVSSMNNSPHKDITGAKPYKTKYIKNRYLVQFLDKSVSETWFNFRFNLDEKHKLDVDYDGPVKVDKYLV